jgi:hypothetical protein
LSRRRSWLLLLALPLVLICAVVPFASLQELHAPVWLASVAALLVFPGLPLLWHFLADRSRATATLGAPASSNVGPALDRFALRSSSLALVVLAVSFANLGPRKVGWGLWQMVRPVDKAPAVSPTAVPAPAPGTVRHELEPFIPADANMVVALSDAAVLQQFLGVNGSNATATLAALEKCQIAMGGARVLIAARDADTRLVVVRADGITDPRNLYCVVGVLGKERLSLRFSSDKAPVSFDVEGLLARPLKFKAVDARTVIAAEGGWAESPGPLLYPPGATMIDGPLATVLARLDRGASLWSASIRQTAEGPWDLAIDAHFAGSHFNLRGSSIPPSGKADQAEGELRVPLGFANALPAGALNDGIRGLVAVVAASGPGVVSGKSAPRP